MVRDEADIVAETVGWMLEQVDEVHVLDNRSVDGSGEIAAALGARVHSDPEVAFFQSRKLTALARTLGTEWVIPFDADEVWRSTSGERLADALAVVPRRALACDAAVRVHVPTGLDPDGPPVASIQHRRRLVEAHRGVACRVRDDLTLTPGAHDVHYDEQFVLRVDGLLEVRHFPARSPEQLIRKVRNGAEAYAATGLPRAASHRWTRLNRLSDPDLHKVFDHFHFNPDAEGLDHDPCPLPASATGRRRPAAAQAPAGRVRVSSPGRDQV